jgi:hypothetical protein
MSTKPQINRKYKLIVGDLKTKDGLEVTDLQVSFDISKDSDNSKSTNSASIEVCNLSDEHLKQLQSDYPAAYFYVGYNSLENVKLLFAGEVINITTKKSGTDRVTQLLMGTGYTELNHKTSNSTLPSGRTVRDVFEEIRKKIPNIDRGLYNGTNLNSSLINGYSISGSLKEELDTLADTFGVEWRIDNNVLYVNDRDRAENENFADAYVISPSSGLIEIPFYTSGDKRRSKADKVKKQGVQFNMLINPEVYPAKIIKLEDTEIIGWFKVDSVRYSGSWRNGDWLQEVLCSSLEKINKK